MNATGIASGPGTLTLTWPGVEHSLTLLESGAGIIATLRVVKPKGTQEIPFDLPPDITLDHVRRAWEQQNNRWEDLYVLRGNPVFLAVRTIRLDPHGGIFWIVHHVDDKPDDRCFFTPIGTDIH